MEKCTHPPVVSNKRNKENNTPNLKQQQQKTKYINYQHYHYYHHSYYRYHLSLHNTTSITGDESVKSLFCCCCN